MSHAATNWAIQQRGLKPAAKLVLWYLCDRHNPDYGCFPSQDQLAADAEMSRSSLNNHLAELEAAGLIRRERRHAEDGHRRLSTRYFLAFEKSFVAQSHVQIPDMESESHVQIQAESHVQNLDSNPVIREPVKEEEDARARDAFSEEGWDRLLEIAGYPRMVETPVWWERKTAQRRIDEWMALGLTEAEILRVAEKAREGHDAPLQGPKGLDAAMARAAKEAREPAAPAGAEDALKRLAAIINGDGFCPQSLITNRRRAELLAAGLCTEQKLRERGFY